MIGSGPRVGPMAPRRAALPGPLTQRPRIAVSASRRDLPVRLEAAEVVDPHDVDESRARARMRSIHQRSRAPRALPAVERVAPELAGRAEVVGRHAGRPTAGRPASSWKSSGCAQTSALSWATKIGMSPMIRMPARVRIAHAAPPLLEEEPLLRTRSRATSRRQLAARACRARRARAATSARSHALHAAPPFARLSAMKSAKSSSQAPCLRAERRRSVAPRRPAPPRSKRCDACAQQRLLERDHRAEVDARSGETPARRRRSSPQ